MEHLPVILKKGRPFLVSCSSGSHRAVCPRGKLLCFLNKQCHVEVHSLRAQDQGVTVDGNKHAGVHWVVPPDSSQDCVVDLSSQQSSDLLAVGSDLWLYWYRVCEDGGAREHGGACEGGANDKARLKVEQLAVMNTNGLHTELKKLKYSDPISQLEAVGSHGGQVLLLINSTLICSVSLDPEFHKMAVLRSTFIEPTTDPYTDSSLPQWVGPLVNVLFTQPLLFALTQDGLVFVYNTTSSQCVGVVYAVAYCQYQCSRQADSEELLSSITSGSFKYVSVSEDLTHLVVATDDNNLILINLPDYFQMFPGHYNAFFTKAFLKNQRSRVIAPVHQSTIEREEDGDKLKYGSYAEEKQAESFFPGYHGHINRLQRLDRMVDKFQPSQTRTLNFHKASHLPGLSLFQTKRKRLLKIPGVKNAVSQTTAVEPLTVLKKPWFEEPLSQLGDDVSKSSFNVAFVTGMAKSAICSKSSLLSGLEDALAPSRYSYSHACLLSAPPTSDSELISVEFSSNMVVCYYGTDKSKNGEEKIDKSSLVGGAQVMVNTLAIYQTDKQTYSLSRMTQSCWLLQSTSSDQLLYLANAHMLAVTTFDLSQEEFIGKVLMYGSASVAEELCHLNRWDKCSLPVNALETALELRQLDTLAFFLRSRDSGSSEGEEASQQQSDVDSSVPTLPPLPPEQLDIVVQLLIGAIRRNYVEESYCQFATQLLLMTLGFLTRIIKTQVLLDEQWSSSGEQNTDTNQTGESGREVTRISVSLDDLTRYIDQLRTFLPKADKSGVGSDGVMNVGGVVGPMAYVDQALTKAWNKMSSKEVIKDALLKSKLPLAQTYLVHTRTAGSDKMIGRGLSMESSSLGLSEAVEDHTPGSDTRYDGSLKNMMTVATGFVIEALDEGDLNTAASLLVQMGCDVKASLKHICFHTVSRRLRDFVAEELLASSWLSPSETQALDYLHSLEAFYPVQSYDHAHSLHSKQYPRKIAAFQSTNLPVMPGIVSRLTSIPTIGSLQDIYPENFGGGYSLSQDSAAGQVSTEDSVPTSPYLQVSLASVMQWDSATREKVLIEGIVLCSQTEENGLDAGKVENKDHVFDYQVSRSNLTSAVRFIMSSVPPIEDHTPCPTQTIELCARISHSTQYVQTCLRNELARHGVFVPEELKDLPSLLYRLGQVHSLFTRPHPLTKLSDEESCEDSGAVISLESFHRGFLKYLIENRFYSLMYHYLDHYNLGLDEESISLLGLDQSGEPWVEVLLRYRRAAVLSDDPVVIFQASLSCSHLLLSSGDGSHMTVMGMLSNGRTLMAMASLMSAPVPLEEAMNAANSSQPWYVDSLTLRRAVSAYPSLKAALFPPPPTSFSTAHSQDISVYQLLQGSVPFNISRLFKWQSTNKSVHEENSAGPVELPHFSSPALTEKFAFSEHLNYIYYLRRGQPSFAYANFVAAKLIGHSNTAKRLDRVSSRVYRLAMLDFTNSRLVSSCVAFTEMCERDSTLLRVDSQAAIRVARYTRDTSTRDYLREDADKEMDRCQEIATQFVQLHRSPDNSSMAGSLLTQLETSTHHMVSSGGVELFGLEAEDCWSLVQSFCQCHQLPPSVGFITECARQGQWLPLLCHSQLFSIAPQKVLMIVDKHFSDPSLREHLHLAVSSMVTRGTSPDHAGGSGYGKSRFKRKKLASPKKAKAQQTESLVTTQRELRAKFYSRVGLQPGVGASPHADSSLPGEERLDQTSSVKQEDGSAQQEPSASSTVPPVAPEVEKPLPLEESDLPEDLFSVLLKCHSDTTPWRSLLAHAIALERPLLAILAACYEHSSMVACLCVWLFSTLGPKVMVKAPQLLGIQVQDKHRGDEALRFCADLQWREWSSHDLSLLLVSAMQATPSPVASFTLAFKYFDKRGSCSPLLSWMGFQEEFVLRSDHEKCSKHLSEFNIARDKVLIHNMELSIGDLEWVDELAATMAAHVLVKSPTSFEQYHLLRLLSEAQFGQEFLCGGVLNYHDLYQMSKLLREAGLESDDAFSVSEQFSPSQKTLSEIYRVQVEVDAEFVLKQLLKLEKFDVAKKNATILQSTASLVTVKQAELNLHKLTRSRFSKYEQARLNFFHSCDTTFQREGVEPEQAAEFFESIVHNGIENCSSPVPDSQEATPTDQTTPCSAMECARLLAFGLKWRKRGKVPLTPEQVREVEREIWRWHIKATKETIESLSSSNSSSSSLPFLPEVEETAPFQTLSSDDTSLLSSLSVTAEEKFKGRRRLNELLLPENVPVKIEGSNKSSLTEKEGETFNMLLGRLLNAGLIKQARELAELFNHNSPDLTVVLSIIKLAQGLLTPQQLTQDVLSLVSTHTPLSRHLSSESSLETPQNRPSGEILRLMNSLTDRALYSQECCSVITHSFRLAIVLRTPYASIVSADPFDTLTRILSKTNRDKYTLAGKFSHVCNLEPDLIARYLAECIAAGLSRKGSARDSPKAAVYHPHTSSREFQEMIGHLIKDHAYAQLGNNLLSMAKSLVTPEMPSNEFSAPVEMIIRAHDAFSLGSCVGIADVLTLAQQWVGRLMAGKDFQLMVRLLTGISRYNEMSYIIGLLIKADVFELLVSTGVEKEEQLRVALLDYLRNHGNDPEKIQMVALKFGMFRELAKNKEDQAVAEVKSIKPKQLMANNSETVKKLKLAFELFKSACKTYAQEDILSKAEFCATQARLIALQLSVLQQKKQVINLSARAVLHFMEEQPFAEALIVSEAYRHCTIRADWVNTLYKKVITQGDFRYLSDFRSAFSLSPSLVQELANRYLRDKEKTFEMTNNMKRILSTHLKNLPLRNKLCIQLGFKDLSASSMFDETLLSDLTRL